MRDKRIMANGRLIQNMTNGEIWEYYDSPKARESFRMMVDMLVRIDKRYHTRWYFQRYGEQPDLSDYRVDVHEAAWNLIEGFYNCVLTQRDMEYFAWIQEKAGIESHLEGIEETRRKLDAICKEIGAEKKHIILSLH